MKRKVFSLMMLCLFAFLGMASAQPGNNMSVAPDPVDLGYRPLGAWMRPFEVQFTSTTSATQTITAIEADKAFFVIDADLPGTVSSSHPFNFTIMHGEAAEGPVSGQLLAMTSNRTAYLFDIMAIAYNPIEADVVETAPAIELPFSQLVEGEIYDNYLLPGATPDGKDVVYKMTIEDDILFNAEVEGENGKIALYTEGFNGQPGPGADNNFTGITTGGGAGTPFEALIGDENSTTQSYYFPFRTLYDNSIAEQLYLATELAEAGVNTLPMASLSFEAKNSTGKLQQGISIWMANVSDDVLTSTSHNTSNMTLVYTGSVTPLVGWNEFVFNENQFAWDGFSNVLVCVQRNNGDWNSDINWKSHNPGFTALAYNYRDNTGYDMTANTYTVYNSSISRVNTLFKSIDAKNAGRGDNMISDMTLTPGVYYLAASSTSDAFTVSANMDLLPLPEQAVNPSPADGQTDVANPAILSWEFGNYTTAYRVLLGTTYPPTQVLVDWTNELSNTAVASNLANNKTYFWRVDERNTNGITEGQIWGFITTLNIPQNLAAATEKIYEGDALQLSWVPMDRSFRGYNVYQDGVKLNDNLLTAAQYTVNGLTYNMTDGYVFNVTAVYDEGESAFSNDLVAFVTGKGTVSGKVTEVDGTTGIAGVEVTLEGIDEFDAAASYTFTTGANGTFTGPVWAGDYTAWAAKEGYQVAQYDGEFHVTYNETTPNINFILDENWVPLGEVIAEEVDENQVKVYWSQTVMSEIIEDFETGDFSSFDWVNDATYPWTIVGGGVDNSQCMKSGNAGVNSSTSAIEVNVEIGRDGLMSFYHKISSETNWDKGYFYIDGTEMIVVSGAGSWQEKEFPITAGVHNFKWAYTKDGSLSSNDDCWYVDNINFIHDPAPAGAGWIGYDNETNESGVGAGGSFYWGISFPTAFMAQYNGFTMTKVKMFDREPHTGTVSIYQGGESAPGTLVTQQAFTCTGSESYVEVTLSNPVSINPSQSLWIVLYNDNGQYPAACCAYTGDPNSRWVSLDGVDWMELTEAAASLNYSWQIQAYMTDNAKTIVLDHKDVAAPAAPVVKGTPATSLSNLMSDPNATASGNRAFHHFNIYRTTCDDVEAENAEFLGSINDTIYLDNDWATLQPGVYKWGVSRFYQGNRNRNRVTYDFESDLQGWTTIDNDGDGYNWEHSSSDGTVAHSGTGVATSASYINYYGALTPDNWLVSPQVALGGTMTFWAAGQDPSYAQEHFAVYVSTSGTAVSNFTQVMSETVASGTMTQYTVDLSAYSGQGYVAIRHYNVTDMFRLNVDDITLGEGGDDPNPPTPPTPPTPTGGGEITYTGVYGESGVMWSNCLENKMYVSTSITVTLNSGESPEGTTVAMHNISEPDLNMTYNATLDETGIYVWESMRRGTYEININKTGYEPVAETVEIGDVNNLQYELVEIIQAIGDLYVSGTGWAIFGDIPAPVDPDTPPTPPTGGWQEGFENGGIPADWTVVDANNDSYTWTATSAIPTTWTYYASLSLDWYHNGTDAVCSGSYINGVGALNPDEYLIAPQVTPTNGSTFSFWAAATDANYPADHFGVFVSTTGTNPSDFTSVQEWTLTAKGNGANGGRASRDGKGAKLGTWYNYSVDLSAYAGQSIYVAIRHFNCYDQYIMCVDDVEFTTNRGLESYNVKLDDVFEGNTTHPFFQHNVENLVEGETYTTSVQAVYGTGVSEWVSFDWVYTPCDNFEGLKSASAEWAGEDVVLTWELPEGGDVPGPVDPDPPTPPTGDVYDFEDGTPQGWTSIDADGDGFGWNMMSSFGTGYGHNGSLDGVYSQSYDNNYGVLYPDNYFVSPQVTLGGEIKFWACGQDASYAAEHFGVAVSTTTATANAFTMLQEWTMSAKGNGAPTNETRSGNRAQGNWYQFTVDLSAYAGQTGYVAIRHFNCSDMFYLDVDDIELGGGGDDPNPPTPGANVRGVEIFRDGEWIAEVAAPAQTFTDIEPGEVGEYEIRVVYNGNLEDYTHYTMSCPEIVVPVENICIAPENLEGDYVYYNENDFGAVINWTYPEAVDGEWYQYDDGTYATSVGAGEPFKWAIMLPAGSHQSGLVTKVTLWDVNSPMNGSVAVYTGTAAEPQTLLASAEVEFDGTQEEMNFVFNELVYVGANDNIWVVVDNPNSTQYPAAASADVTNDPNGRWVYLESSGWLDLAAAGLPGYSWMIHCYISETLFFEVFRNGELIADVPYNDSEIQTYYDQVGIGNYQYQVIAVTDNCESDFALTPDLLHDFVEIHVTSVTENIATRVYPNPTTGIVTIEANGMNHITVVNTLGQTVLDTNISGDQYQLNLGQFQAGVYMVRIATEEGVSVQRVTVAK